MKFLKKLFGEEPRASLHPELQQPEREAIVDLLILAVYVDDHLSLSESKQFDDSAETLDWEATTSLDAYVSAATARARDARGNEAQCQVFIDYAAQRLKTPASKERALELLNKLFMADGKTDTEKAFFQKVEAALGES